MIIKFLTLYIIFISGTHGIMELADVNGNMVEIYLYGGNQLPVPR